MSFGSVETTWNRFKGSYFNQGVAVQGNVVDTLEGNSSTITTACAFTVNSTLDVSRTPTFYCKGSLPTALTGGSRGVGIYWNVMSRSGYGETSYLNYAQGGGGGHSWYYANSVTAPTILMKLDSGKNLSLLNDVSCVSLFLGTNSLSSALLGYLSTITSNVQTQYDAIITAVGALQLLSLSTTLLSYLSTISSNVQTQLNTINTAILSIRLLIRSIQFEYYLFWTCNIFSC